MDIKMNNLWKEPAVTYLQVSCGNFLEETEKRDETPLNKGSRRSGRN
jgi:hypothetical protein